ncbi:reverse transcriptase domain-containing protein [Providencia alcalifaciens]
MTYYQEKWLYKFELKENHWIYVPTKVERQKGISLLDDLYSKWLPPLYYYHLRNGGHVAALKVHLENKYFAHIDLKGFFNSTGRSRITRVLKEFYPFEKAREIAKFSTVKNLVNFTPSHVLPFGFVQSPILATLCLHKSFLGNRIRTYFNRKDIKISVYMDDIIISSLEKNVLSEIYSDLIESIKISHYLINEIKSQPPSEQIIVFNIYLSQNKLRITEERILEFLINYTRAKSSKVKEGIKSYVQTINILQSKIFV